jgi:hypothetical protein
MFLQPASDYQAGPTNSSPTVQKNGASFPDATVDRQEDLTQISCRPRHAEIRNRKPIVRYRNVRTKGFLGKNRVIGNQFARFSQIDEMSNADVQELVDLPTCFDRVFVSRIFSSKKFMRDNPIGVQVGSRGSFRGHIGSRSSGVTGVQELQEAPGRV